MSLPPILNRALNAAYEGANEIIQFSKRIDNLKIIKKGENDFTTNLDKYVEEKVFENLKQYYPDFGYLGEESGANGIDDKECSWVLDPVDGTRNYIYQYPHYALSLACIKEGKVICAVIIDPVRDDVFLAGEGTGALLNNKRIRASNKSNLNNALLSSTGHTNKDQNYVYKPLDTYMALNEFDVTVRRSGCTSLDIAYCAAGKLDGFWGHGLRPWDRLAALFIAQSAGCLISDFNGTPDTYESDHIIIATPKCFKDLSKCVRAGYQSKE
jgi:myo-inositol-1(or 4)-monophosphatase